jgi:hypothetical protein
MPRFPQPAAERLTEAERAEALVSAMAAHVQGQPLPSYEPLDPTDRDALVGWGVAS